MVGLLSFKLDGSTVGPPMGVVALATVCGRDLVERSTVAEAPRANLPHGMPSIGLLQERQIGEHLRFVDVSVEGEVEAGLPRGTRQLVEECPLALAALHRVLCVGLRHEWVVGDEDL